MASNQIPTSYFAILELAEDMINGLQDHAGRIGVLQWTEAKLTILLAAVRFTHAAHTAATTAENLISTQRKIANSNAKAFIATAKRMLSDDLGSTPNRGWEEAGWSSGNTEAPGTITDRKKLLDQLVPWLTARPAKEVPQKNFTIAQATNIRGALHNALQALPAAVANRVSAVAAEFEATNNLRNGMSGLAAELDSLLENDHPDWYYFGLVPPAKPEAPAPPEHLIARQAGATTVIVGCDRSPRATRYIFALQVIGRDLQPVLQDPRRDPTITLENLPPAAQVRLTVFTQNAAGGSRTSDPVVITLV